MSRTQPKSANSYNAGSNSSIGRLRNAKRLRDSEENYQRASPFVKALAAPVHAYEKWAITNSNKKGQSPFARFILRKGNPLKKKRSGKFAA